MLFRSSLHRHHYRDFHRRANALGGALQAAGLKPGDRVATLMWNHYAHLEAYFGIPCAGGVLHTLNLRLHPDDIAYIANHAGDRFLIVDDVLLPLLEMVMGENGIKFVRLVQEIIAPADQATMSVQHGRRYELAAEWSRWLAAEDRKSTRLNSSH